MRNEAAWDRGRERFDEGAFWEAHEEWEAAWLTSDGTERRFLGGAILLTAALHKARAMQSPRGGRRNYAKALRHLALVPDRFGGVDVREFEARVHRALREPGYRPAIPRPRAEVDGSAVATGAPGRMDG